MTGGQTAAIGCAALLLLPGGCFLLVGILETDRDGVMIGVAVLAFAGLLTWGALASRSVRPPDAGDPGSSPS